MALRVSRKPSAVSWARIFSGITAVFCRLFFTVVSHCRLDAQKAFTLRHRDCTSDGFSVGLWWRGFKKKKKQERKKRHYCEGRRPTYATWKRRERKKERKKGGKEERKKVSDVESSAWRLRLTMLVITKYLYSNYRFVWSVSWSQI